MISRFVSSFARFHSKGQVVQTVSPIEIDCGGKSRSEIKQEIFRKLAAKMRNLNLRNV